MAISLYNKRFVKFIRIERPDAFVVVAVLFETNGTETYAVSEPKIVKILPKDSVVIQSGKISHGFTLPAPIKELFKGSSPIKSPFFSTIFGFSNTDLVVSLSARPPTK